ncbi:MAG: hypothetical protein OXS47_11480 [Chloroflexota bacterium]|nr:hypothetical protein [Chloroflexota bacterium]
MRLRSVRALATAILVALVAWVVSAPWAALAQDEVPTVTTRLYPGWNMVGWVSNTTAIAELFETIPELREVVAWDAEGEEFRRRTRTSTEPGLTELTPGQGLWLGIEGEAAVDWERPVSEEYVLLSLQAAANLVGWAGADGTPIAEAVGQFGDALHYVYRWDAESQRFDGYVPDGGGWNTLLELNRGDALWVGLAEEARWWQSGTGGTRLAFDEGVTPEREREVRKALARVIGFFAEQYGIEPPEFSIGLREGANSFALDLSMESPPDSWGWGTAFFGRSTKPTGDALESRLVHEYFRVLQNHLLGHGYPHRPAWMADGAAAYAAAVYEVAMQEVPGESIRQGWLKSLARSRGSLSEFEARSFGRANEMSSSAVDWLVSRATEQGADSAVATSREPLDREGLTGSDAHIQYLRLLPSSATWQEAFETAFGISPEDFYDEFDLYRERLRFNQVAESLFGLDPEEFQEDFGPYYEAASTPLTHLTDNVVRPAMTFLGDVPSTTRTRYQSELDDVFRFLANHMGADPFEYSVYVAADDAAARPTYYGLSRQGLVGGAYSCSFSNSRRVIFYVLACAYPLDHRTHFRGYFDVLRSRTQTSARWLSSGIYEYVATVYEETIEQGSLDDSFRRFVTYMQRNPATLEQIETHQGWHAAGNNESWGLAFVAIEFLARQAGDPALIEYFRLLPRGEPGTVDYEPGAGSWQAAFEQAFGLTVDDFYELFAEYRSGLTQP